MEKRLKKKTIICILHSVLIFLNYDFVLMVPDRIIAILSSLVTSEILFAFLIHIILYWKRLHIKIRFSL